MNPGKVRIVSDGSPHGTQVSVDGVALRYVTHVAWELDVDSDVATATFTVLNVEVDVVGEVGS